MSGTLYDPVHFFNSRGLSILLAEDQSKRIAELEQEVADLHRKLQKAATVIREQQARAKAF